MAPKDVTRLLKALNEKILPQQELSTKLLHSLHLMKDFFDLQELHLIVHQVQTPLSTIHIPETSLYKQAILKELPKTMTHYEVISKSIADDKAHYMSLGSFATLVFLTQHTMSDFELDQFKQVIIFLDQFFYSLKQQEQTYSKVTRYFEERQFFRKVIDTIPDMIAVKNHENRYILINEAARAFYQPRMGDLEGKTVDEVYPPDQASIVKSLDAEALQAKKTIQRRFKMYQSEQPEGSWVESIRTPIYDKNQDVLGLISISRDIDEVETERAINERNNRFQRILLDLASRYINIHVDEQEESINEVLKKSGEFIDADRAYVFLYHFDRNLIEYKYEWCKEGIEPQINNEHVQFVNVDDFVDGWVDLHLEGKPVYIPDVDALDKDSMAYQTLSIQDIKSLVTLPLMAQHRCLGFVGFDDVRQKRPWNESEFALLEVLAQIITNILIKLEQEHALIESKLNAEKANEAKSVFLANVSHDIRTPLAAMSNALYLIEDLAVNAHTKEMVKVLDISLSNMSQLINNILDITKIESQEVEVQTEWFDLETLICHTLKTQKPLADQQGIELIFDYDYAIPSQLYGDRLKIQQILTNLLNNALKFTLEGRVTVHAKLKEKSKKHAQIHLSVKDTGVGIREEHIGKLVEKFYRIQEASVKAQSGTGLGLPIVEQLIKALGGSLEIESVYQQGSIFSTTLSFPYSKATLSMDWVKGINKPVYVIAEEKILSQKVHEFLTYLEAAPQFINVNQFLALPPQTEMLGMVLLYDERMSEQLEALVDRLKHTPAFKMLYTDTMIPPKGFKTLEAYVDFVVDFCASRATIFDYITQYLNRQTPPVNAPIPSDLPRDKHILVVEDNPLNRQTIALILRKQGYSVDEAECGEAAIEKATQTTYHAVIMDIQLPGMDGLSTMKHIKQLWGQSNHTPFIATTAHAVKESLTQYYEEGFSEVMTKPMNISLLLDFLDHNGASPSDGVAPLKHVQVFDYEALVARFDHQDDIARAMIQMYLKQYPNDLSAMDKALEDQNIELLNRQLHTFKGSLDYLGAADVSTEIRTLMDESKALTHTQIKERLTDLKKAIINWSEQLRQKMEEKDGMTDV